MQNQDQKQHIPERPILVIHKPWPLAERKRASCFGHIFAGWCAWRGCCVPVSIVRVRVIVRVRAIHLHTLPTRRKEPKIETGDQMRRESTEKGRLEKTACPSSWMINRFTGLEVGGRTESKRWSPFIPVSWQKFEEVMAISSAIICHVSPRNLHWNFSLGFEEDVMADVAASCPLVWRLELKSCWHTPSLSFWANMHCTSPMLHMQCGRQIRSGAWSTRAIHETIRSSQTDSWYIPFPVTYISLTYKELLCMGAKKSSTISTFLCSVPTLATR